MPLMTVTAAIAGLKNTIDLAKAAIATRDELKLAEMQQSINDRVIDVQNAALALQEKQSAARDEIDELKEQIRASNAKVAELEELLNERAEYKLHALTPRGFAYRYVGTDEPEHYICQGCFDNKPKRKVVLLYRPGVPGRIYERYKCPACETEVRV